MNWIKCSERLPGYNEIVIFGYVGNKKSFIGFIDGDKNREYISVIGNGQLAKIGARIVERIDKLTRWMPLPPCPEK